MAESVDLHGNAYGNFATDVLSEVRRETYGRDIGQSGWMTSHEFRLFFDWLEITPHSHVLDLCSRSGGPALFLSETAGCRVTGVDISETGTATARRLAQERGLAERLHFEQADATKRLPLPDALFDSAVSIDAIIHLPDRHAVLRECHRVLKPHGRLLYTDPTMVTGLVSKEELAIRASIGSFVFSTRGEIDRLLAESGFKLLRAEDVTANAALISNGWHDARHLRSVQLISLEGPGTFEGLQQFLLTVHRLASERRLSRYAFLSVKIGDEG